MSKADGRYYVRGCGLLTVPIFVWNLVCTRFLPPALAAQEFWRDIPALVAYGEHGFRLAVVLLPFLMPLEVRTVAQRRGLLLFVVGTVVYVLAWVALIAACAVGLSATLCTFNVKHYRVVPDLVMSQPYMR